MEANRRYSEKTEACLGAQRREGGREREAEEETETEKLRVRETEEPQQETPLYPMTNIKKAKTALRPEGKDTHGQSQISEVPKQTNSRAGKSAGSAETQMETRREPTEEETLRGVQGHAGHRGVQRPLVSCGSPGGSWRGSSPGRPRPAGAVGTAWRRRARSSQLGRRPPLPREGVSLFPHLKLP